MTEAKALRDGVHDPSRDPSLAELLRMLARKINLDLRVSIPGKVIAFDASTQMAKVSIEVLGVAIEPNTGEDIPNAPLIVDQVPVHFVGNAAGAYLTLPIIPGTTTGLLIFCDRSIATWLTQGIAAPPAEAHTHRITDAVFIPGVNPKVAPITPPVDATAAVLEAALIKIGATATEAAMLGTAFTTLFNAHTHTGVTAGPGTSGTPSAPMLPGVHTSATVKVKG